MRWESAIYNKAILPEHQGNPLIEALPKKVSDGMLVERLAYYPDHDDSVRTLDDIIRQDYLVRLDQLRQPLPEYIACFRMIEAAIKESYSTKNPFSPTTTYYLSYLSHSQPSTVPKSGPFNPRGAAMTVVGISGIGKTKMLEQILEYFPQVIEHKEYDGKGFALRQLIWLKVECPHETGLRGLCHTILGQIDTALRASPTVPERNIDTLLDQIERKVKSSFIGIIVIDEMQNLNIGKAGGADKLLSFLLNLINRCGVPILFCGNPQISDLFKRTFRNARRAESGGFIEMDRLLQDDVWNYFVEELWELQWTNVKTPLTSELDLKLYELSAGILGIAVGIYKKAQELVIGSDDERITEEVLEMGYQNACKLTDSGLSLLRRHKSGDAKNRKVIKEHYDDLVLDDDKSWLTDFGNTKSNIQNNTRKIKHQPVNAVPGDLTRPQHPEFAEKIRELQLAENLHARIVDPDLFQRAANEEHTLQFLKSAGTLCDAPLSQLS
jgi:hypothetical protein